MKWLERKSSYCFKILTFVKLDIGSKPYIYNTMSFGRKLYSIFKFKCPRCCKGEFLESRNVYDLKKAGNLKKNCSHCGLKYSKEPGFYYGAMYVTYALGVAIMVAVWIAFEVLYPDYTIGAIVAVISAVVILGAPYLYALSKIIWANILFTIKKRN